MAKILTHWTNILNTLQIVESHRLLLTIIFSLQYFWCESYVLSLLFCVPLIKSFLEYYCLKSRFNLHLMEEHFPTDVKKWFENWSGLDMLFLLCFELRRQIILETRKRRKLPNMKCEIFLKCWILTETTRPGFTACIHNKKDES